jgi:hypothetical protein
MDHHPGPVAMGAQGFGEYDYGRDYRTYGKKFRFADEKGLYKYTFRVPENWKGKQVLSCSKAR